MLKIFAKHGTDEKIAIYCQRREILQLQNKFNQQYGGEWLLVDECLTIGEFLKFNDGQIYQGFELNQSDNFRYSKAITQLNK